MANTNILKLKLQDDDSRAASFERANEHRALAKFAIDQAAAAREATLREAHLLLARGWTKLADYYDSQASPSASRRL